MSERPIPQEAIDAATKAIYGLHPGNTYTTGKRDARAALRAAFAVLPVSPSPVPDEGERPIVGMSENIGILPHGPIAKMLRDPQEPSE